MKDDKVCSTHEPFETCGHHEHGESCVFLVPIFNHLEKAQMDEIRELTRPENYKKGELMYREGEQSDSLYIVNEGRIRIYRLSESGKEQLIRILHPGDFTGELDLFNESMHDSYAEAMENTSICVVNRADLQALILKYPSIGLKVLSEFSQRLKQSETLTTRFAMERVETRISLFILEYYEAAGKKKDVVLPMSRKDMASYLGTTPETVSRKLHEFQDAGLIRQKSSRVLVILDEPGLRQV